MNEQRRRRINLFRRLPWIKVLIISGMLGVVIWGVIISLKSDEPKILLLEEIPGISHEASSGDGEVKISLEFSNIWEYRPVLTEKKLIALTFDDGPSEHTDRLLSILKDNGVRATFFALGSRAAAFPDVIRKEAAGGHEVESHTMNHVDLSKLSEVGVRSEADGAVASICGALGKERCIKYVRPPYGAVGVAVRNVIKQPLMGWSVDSLDWKIRNSEMIKAEVLGHAFDGAIVLMHDVYDTTVDAVEGVISALRGDGYTFVTVDELVQERRPNLETGVLYGIFKP